MFGVCFAHALYWQPLGLESFQKIQLQLSARSLTRLCLVKHGRAKSWQIVLGLCPEYLAFLLFAHLIMPVFGLCTSLE